MVTRSTLPGAAQVRWKALLPLCACASTTPGGVSGARAPTSATIARAANAPKEIRINLSSCLLATCGGLRYYAK